MAGFSVIISEKNHFPETLQFPGSNAINPIGNHLIRSISNESIRVQQNTHNKFPEDTILGENENYIIVTDGVLLNLSEMLMKHNQKNCFELMVFLYERMGVEFTKSLRGDFSGIIYDKKNKTCFCFTNHTGSKRIFHYHQNDYLIVCTDLAKLSSLLHELKISIHLNQTAAYLLLTCGFMLEQHTLIENVKRLMPGSYLLYSDYKVKISNYFHLTNVVQTKDSRDEIIERMDELFSNAVKLEFEKDKAYGYKHAATLSGGLDSRMTVLIAHKLGYTDQLNYTFSQTGYLDEKIARKIANDHNHKFYFQPLDGGDYLKAIDETVMINDGLVSYSSAAHALFTIKKMNLETYGLIHTGMIGDAVIGSFLSAPDTVQPTYTDGMFSKSLAHKVQKEITEIISCYPDEESYKFYSRAFLGAMTGNYAVDVTTQAISPFLEPDFLSYCYSIPKAMKYKQRIYLEWIADKHPEFAKYPWEKTGVSPLKSNNWKKFTEIGYYQRMSLKLFDRINSKISSGMNPMDYWFSNNESLRNFIESYFIKHIELLNAYPELQNDSRLLFENGNSGEKFQVLTLLSAIQLHGIKN